jgi:hypothetical protein
MCKLWELGFGGECGGLTVVNPMCAFSIRGTAMSYIEGVPTFLYTLQLNGINEVGE